MPSVQQVLRSTLGLTKMNRGECDPVILSSVYTALKYTYQASKLPSAIQTLSELIIAFHLQLRLWLNLKTVCFYLKHYLDKRETKLKLRGLQLFGFLFSRVPTYYTTIEQNLKLLLFPGIGLTLAYVSTEKKCNVNH